jgi:hypothetical protein
MGLVRRKALMNKGLRHDKHLVVTGWERAVRRKALMNKGLRLGLASPSRRAIPDVTRKPLRYDIKSVDDFL